MHWQLTNRIKIKMRKIEKVERLGKKKKSLSTLLRVFLFTEYAETIFVQCISTNLWVWNWIRSE